MRCPRVLPRPRWLPHQLRRAQPWLTAPLRLGSKCLWHVVPVLGAACFPCGVCGVTLGRLLQVARQHEAPLPPQRSTPTASTLTYPTVFVFNGVQFQSPHRPLAPLTATSPPSCVFMWAGRARRSGRKYFLHLGLKRVAAWGSRAPLQSRRVACLGILTRVNVMEREYQGNGGPLRCISRRKDQVIASGSEASLPKKVPCGV